MGIDVSLHYVERAEDEPAGEVIPVIPELGDPSPRLLKVPGDPGLQEDYGVAIRSWRP